MTNSNDPTYPTDEKWEYEDPGAGKFTRYKIPKYPGLTKREYFAAMAMQGILGTRNHSVYYVDRHSDDDIISADTHNAVRIADALIAELNKEQK